METVRAFLTRLIRPSRAAGPRAAPPEQIHGQGAR